jgi:hypothetical protein
MSFIIEALPGSLGLGFSFFVLDNPHHHDKRTGAGTSIGIGIGIGGFWSASNRSWRRLLAMRKIRRSVEDVDEPAEKRREMRRLLHPGMCAQRRLGSEVPGFTTAALSDGMNPVALLMLHLDVVGIF